MVEKIKSKIEADIKTYERSLEERITEYLKLEDLVSKAYSDAELAKAKDIIQTEYNMAHNGSSSSTKYYTEGIMYYAQELMDKDTQNESTRLAIKELEQKCELLENIGLDKLDTFLKAFRYELEDYLEELRDEENSNRFYD